jgi:hypothetical protein
MLDHRINLAVSCNPWSLLSPSDHGVKSPPRREVVMQGMNNAHRRKNFTPSDDALIRQQPLTGIGLKRLADILRTNQEAIRHRATELGVSLIFGLESDGAIDTRTLRCTDGFVDPLLERLQNVHGK